MNADCITPDLLYGVLKSSWRKYL